MVVTTSWIESNYNKFNKVYWNGKLPKISFKISNSKKTWGYASYYLSCVSSTVTPLEIVMSNYYDSPEFVKLTTLLHEMIHIADYTFNPHHFVRNGKRVRYDAHGTWFKSEAKRLSKDGWDIEKYVTEEEESVSSLTTKNAAKEQATKDVAVICACYCGNDNVWYFKTNDCNIENILNAISKVNWKNEGGINNIKFYKFNNPRLAMTRSCISRLKGYHVSNIQFDIRIKEWSMKEVSIKSSAINKTLKIAA